MTTVELLNTIVSALVLAAIYSLITMGYVVVYRSSHVFNFVNPEFMLIGALIFSSISTGSVWGFVLALVVSVAATTIGAGTLYRTVIHRGTGLPHWVQMVLTMGLAAVGLNVAQLVAGSDLRYVRLPFEKVTWNVLGGATVTSDDVVILVSCLAVSSSMFWVLCRTSLGTRLRAAAENPGLAGTSGISTMWSFTLVWGLAAAAATVAGIAYSIRVPLSPTIVGVGLVAFPASMLGGMDSVGGALVGALLLALVQQFATALLGPQEAVAVSFALVMVVLIVRPQGLFGSRTVERV